VQYWTFRSPKDEFTFKAAAGTGIVNALPGLEEAEVFARDKIVSAILLACTNTNVHVYMLNSLAVRAYSCFI
jgi:hypothetical protein